MAYIPDPEWLPRQSLLIAGDKSLLSLTTPISGDPLLLSAYEVPLPLGSTVALPYRSINEKVFTQGLTASSAVVSSLQYFDKLLYMLFGNEQRIRAFNSSGAMEKEWSLPVSVQDSVSSLTLISILFLSYLLMKKSCHDINPPCPPPSAGKAMGRDVSSEERWQDVYASYS